jgi:thiol:disulfide interchange protein DsbD
LSATAVIFAGGFLTSLTPCVYPLIPITVGVFGARQADSRGRAFVLTSSYVVGMGAVFSALGIFAALSGRAFGSILGNSWVSLALAAVLVALSSSMFGAFELTLPPALATRLNGVGGGGLVGAFLMGSVAGFLAAPCTGPVLLSVLTWVSQTRDPFVGAALLFTYALGIGVPFFLVGVFTVRMPKSGAWMDWVKSFFGIVLLGMAFSYVLGAFPRLGASAQATLAAVQPAGLVGAAALLGLVGVLMGAVHKSFGVSSERLMKAVGVVALLGAYGLRSIAPSDFPLGPAEGASGRQAFAWTLVYRSEEGVTNSAFASALAAAQSDCKPVMLDFFADWCAACQELDEHTYTSPAVVAESQRFRTIKIDGTTSTTALDELYEKYGIQGLPTVIFIDPTGHVLERPRVSGFLPPDAFLKEMQKVALTSCSRGGVQAN